MESYGMKKPKEEIFFAIRAIVLEIFVIVVICSSVLGILNYFNIISLSTIVSLIPFMPNAERQEISDNEINNTTKSTALPKRDANSSKETSLKFNAEIIEVNVLGGKVKNKKGEVIEYLYKLKVKTAYGETTYYYEQVDVPNISVLQKQSDGNKVISFSDLKVGDRIEMDNTFENQSLTIKKLVITKL